MEVNVKNEIKNLFQLRLFIYSLLASRHAQNVSESFRSHPSHEFLNRRHSRLNFLSSVKERKNQTTGVFIVINVKDFWYKMMQRNVHKILFALYQCGCLFNSSCLYLSIADRFIWEWETCESSVVLYFCPIQLKLELERRKIKNFVWKC